MADFQKIDAMIILANKDTAKSGIRDKIPTTRPFKFTIFSTIILLHTVLLSQAKILYQSILQDCLQHQLQIKLII